jgi:nucleotide-binding universal stress UspA family protein
MSPIRHILVPTDFGEPARRAVDYAVELASKFDAKITILHVYEAPMFPYAIGIYLPTEELYTAAKKAAQETAAAARSRWSNLDAFVAEGNPVEQILRVAKDQSVDLIVMGTQGHRGVARALLGSVAETVVRLSPVPVLSVHAEAKRAPSAPPT